MMDSFETSFVRSDGNNLDILHSNAEGSIKTASFADVFINSYEISTKEQFISPGIVITQENAKMTGRAVDNTIMFEHEALHRLANIHLDHEHIFATDAIGKLYIYTNGEDWPSVLSIQRTPIGVCYIPNTKSLLYWTALTLHVYDGETAEDQILKNRHTRITAVACTTSVAVSGDSSGKICIWFISSWECHHTIDTGRPEIQDIKIIGQDVFVLTSTSLQKYNVATGHNHGSLDIKAKNMIALGDGLLLSSRRHMTLICQMKPILCIYHMHQRLISAQEGRRFFTLSSGKIMECEWPSMQWPYEFLTFLKAPAISMVKNWPKNTHLDVLASTAEIWMPNITNFNFPKQWFRHTGLRNAIWDFIITKDIDISSKWEFLTSHIMQKWYDKNMQVLKLLIQEQEYNATAAMILHRIYKHIDITNTQLQQWCWNHHGKIALRHINVHILGNTDNLALWRYISKNPVTDASAHLLTNKVVKNGLKHGFVSVFIRMLLKFNQHGAPSHHMKSAFKMIVSYIYSNLSASDMNSPLKESGTWIPLRPAPNHVGSYIRHRNLKGYITKIKFNPLQIQWIPDRSTVELIIARDEHVDTWQYFNKNAPNTLLECALTMFCKEKWKTDARIREWVWFETELGAFHNENISVRVFDQPSRIIKTIYDENPRIHLSSGMIVEKTETVTLTSVTPLWSYYEDQMHHIIPMKLKICNEISRHQGKTYPSVEYAKELISTIQYNVIDKEHRHRVPHRVTAVKKYLNGFFVAITTGEILEYDSIAAFVPSRHFIKHTNPVIGISVIDSRMMSVCDEEMNVWCLYSGTLLFGHVSSVKIHGCILSHDCYVWLVEKDEHNILLTLWDTFQEIETEHHIIESKGEIFTTDTPAIVCGKYIFSLNKQRHKYEIDILGDVTCACDTFNGICGGTSDGVFFVLDLESNEVVQWSSIENHPVTAVTAMDDQPYAITGTEFGEIIVWKIDHRDTRVVNISKITNCRIEHIVFHNMFAAAIFRQNVQMLSVIHSRAVLAVDVLYAIMQWSEKWKDRIMLETSRLLKPAIEACIMQNRAFEQAVDLLELCTEHYQDRLAFCQQEFIDILLETPISVSRHIIKRLLCFRGPRIECAICHEQQETHISYLKPCNHRFHTDCILEMVRKRPEYHHEMQEEYALHYNLMCPVCREPFTEEDIKTDTFLSFQKK